ncbi:MULTISPECIES: glycolate oxidase subunit GlcE [unclassified Thioalkalivibrio]|uniref:glycolate oxidase subunit GlcE n=1 Tax=unclassified Thioalkalivibrio TaxID=2621013 RepID=UPI000378ABEB|nr:MULTISPECIES: glycolate oxidase subunit GlcE [unclassified Thioalkalivibrio]
MRDNKDHAAPLAEAIREASVAGTRIAVRGGRQHGDQSFPDGLPSGVLQLETREHRGIATLEPSELVVTVRSGTPVVTLDQALAEVGMMLPFEPALGNPEATVGGMVALGMSGPRRPWAAALRDAVLGTRVVNGRGEILQFGGQVMKNVAGFDVSRLMCGSQGGLGLILETSFKLLPRPPCERYLQREDDAESFVARCSAWGRTGWPFSGIAWHDGVTHIRLGGGEEAVDEAIQRIDAEPGDPARGFWDALRDRSLPLFTDELAAEARLWRISLPPATEPLALSGEWLMNWGGAERWLRTTEHAETVRRVVTDAGGHARLWLGDAPGVPRLHPRGEALEALEGRLRESLDPDGVFFAPLLPNPRSRRPRTT